MSVLSACRKASQLLIPGRIKPVSIFSSSDEYEIELGAIAQEAATTIAKDHDWRALAKLGTFTGISGAASFALPVDCDRLSKGAALFSSKTTMPLSQINDLNEWRDLKLRNFSGLVGSWIMMGDSVQFNPAPTDGEAITFYYQSSFIVRENPPIHSPGETVYKEDFEEDTDVFVVSDRLLTLGITWRWRQRKGLDYAEEMQNYEIALEQEIGRDRAPSPIAVGRARLRPGVNLAYPGIISGT